MTCSLWLSEKYTEPFSIQDISRWLNVPLDSAENIPPSLFVRQARRRAAWLAANKKRIMELY